MKPLKFYYDESQSKCQIFFINNRILNQSLHFMLMFLCKYFENKFNTCIEIVHSGKLTEYDIFCSSLKALIVHSELKDKTILLTHKNGG